MQVHEFPCPGCRARLRLKGRPSSSRQLDCPECQVRFVVKSDDAGTVETEILAKSDQRTLSHDPSEVRPNGKVSRLLQPIRQHPSRAAWSAVSVLVLALVIWLLNGPEDMPDKAARLAGTEQTESEVLNAKTLVTPSEELERSGVPADGHASDNGSTSDKGQPVQPDREGGPQNPELVGEGTGAITGDTGELADNQTGVSTVDDPPVIDESGSDSLLEKGLAEVAGFLSSGVDVADPFSPGHSPDLSGEENSPSVADSVSDAESGAELVPVPVLKTAEEFDATLQIRFVEYQQAEPVSLKYQLAELNEILEVPFVLSEELQSRDPAWWDRPLVVSLKQCTVKEILNHIINEAGLIADFRDGELHLDAAPERSEGE